MSEVKSEVKFLREVPLTTYVAGKCKHLMTCEVKEVKFLSEVPQGSSSVAPQRCTSMMSGKSLI